MQCHPIFINVSRGALVDEDALINALNTGQISAAALDVFSQEPLDRIDHPLATLFGRENVILFPHLTFFTRSAMRRLSEDTLARCREILSGDTLTIRSTDPRLTVQAESLHVKLE